MTTAGEIAGWVRDPTRVPFPSGLRLGGRYKCSPDDFLVEELSAFGADGRSGHRWLYVEKRELSTSALLAALAEQLGCQPRDLSYAGSKDVMAITRQWVSVPERFAARVEPLSDQRFTVLDEQRNSTKLHLGDLAGNRFRVVVRYLQKPSWDENDFPPFFPNYFGPQRFGLHRDNHQRGLELLRHPVSERVDNYRRLMLHAAQSALFNAYLAVRVTEGTFASLLPGDRAQSLSGRALRPLELESVASGKAIPCGPLFGSRMLPATSVARALEERVLSAATCDEAQFDAYPRVTTGARRALVVRPRDLRVDAVGDDAVALSFELPAGAYASTLLQSLGAEQD